MRTEPVAVTAGIVAIINAVIPVLLLFGVINWSEEQIGAVILAVGVVATTLGGWFARSRVSPI